MKSISWLIIVFASLLIACDKKAENIVLLDDDFSTNSTWLIQDQSDYSYGYNNGQYEIIVNTIGYMYWAYAPYGYGTFGGAINFPYSIKVDCTIKLDDYSKLGYAGLMFNYIDNNNFSIVRISNNGYYGIFQKVNGSFNDIKPWTVSSAISSIDSSTNTLEMIQKETEAEFKINNQSMGSFPIEKTNSNVRVGLITISADSANFTRVTGSFDNFVLTKIQ